jgi:hypothetical protein
MHPPAAQHVSPWLLMIVIVATLVVLATTLVLVLNPSIIHAISVLVRHVPPQACGSSIGPCD